MVSGSEIDALPRTPCFEKLWALKNIWALKNCEPLKTVVPTFPSNPDLRAVS